MVLDQCCYTLYRYQVRAVIWLISRQRLHVCRQEQLDLKKGSRDHWHVWNILKRYLQNNSLLLVWIFVKSKVTELREYIDTHNYLKM